MVNDTKPARRPRKIWLDALIVIAVMILAKEGYDLRNWYLFPTHAVMTKADGIFADPHLAEWDKLNDILPDAASKWACDKLLHRQEAEVGIAYGSGKAVPASCSPTLGDYRQVDTVILENYGREAQRVASAKGASQEQLATINTCVITGLKTAVPADVLAKVGSADAPEASPKVSEAGSKVLHDCLAKSGFQ